jgi:hypothetical protein
VVIQFATWANEQDFANAESQLTPRLLEAIAPGQFKTIWIPGDIVDTELVRLSENTAVIDLEFLLDPDDVGPPLGLSGEQLQDWVENPAPEQPSFDDKARIIATFLPAEGKLQSRLRFELYRVANTWKIEIYRPETINLAALEPPQLTGPTEPFVLTGRVRTTNSSEQWLGIDILESSDNLELYQEGWVAVLMDELETFEDSEQTQRQWSELSANEIVEIKGLVRFAAQADPSGRLPASIVADELMVVPTSNE